MALPYSFWRSLQDSRALPVELQMENSQTLPDGALTLWSVNGKQAQIVNNTDRPLYALQGAAMSTANGSQENLGSNPQVLNTVANGFNSTAGPGGNQQVQQVGAFATFVPLGNGMDVWRTQFTPVIPAFVANVSGSPTSIICPNSPLTFAISRFVGGTILCKSTGQQFRITASTAVTAGSPITFTIAEPIGKIGATINADGLTFVASPLGPGMAGYKFGTASGTVASDGYVPSQLGVGSADAAGGFLQIFDVDLLNNYVFVIFN